MVLNVAAVSNDTFCLYLMEIVHLLGVVRVGALGAPSRLDRAVLACFAHLRLGSQLGGNELSVEHSQALLGRCRRCCIQNLLVLLLLCHSRLICWECKPGSRSKKDLVMGERIN